MKIKKIIAAVFAAAVVMSLAGCGGTPPGSGFADFRSSSAQTESRVTSTKSARSSGSSVESSIDNTPISLPDNFSEGFKKTGEIEGTVLYDQNNIKITATKLNFNNNSADVELVLENDSEKDLTFLSATIGYSCNSVNGYMVDDGYLNCNVSAGKKATNSVSFSYSELRMLGINQISEIELGFEIRSGDIFDHGFDPIYTGPRALIISNGLGIDWFESTFFEAISNPLIQRECGYKPQQVSDKKLFDSDGVKVISEVVGTNSLGTKLLLLEVENTTAMDIRVQTSDIKLNGLTLYGGSYSYDLINPGKRRVIEITYNEAFKSKCLEACGLEETNSLGLTLTLINYNDIELCSETISVVGDALKATFSSNGEEIYNKNGVRIISKGVFEGDSLWRNFTYLVLLVENNTAEERIFNAKYNTISVNGFMNNCFDVSHYISPNSIQAIEICLDTDSLVNNGIESVSDIKNIEFTANIRDSYYHDLDSAHVKATY